MHIKNSLEMCQQSSLKASFYNLGFVLFVCLYLQVNSVLAAESQDGKKAVENSACRDLVTMPTNHNLTLLHDMVMELHLPESFVIGQITYTRQNIFDPDNDDENGFLYMLANDWHFLTKESVIAEKLLFESGSEANKSVLEESERLLRGNHYIYDAEIIPRRICGNKVDVEVITRDVWTLTPDIRLKTSGGKSSLSFVLRDSSFLGSGKQVLVAQNNDSERSGLELGYFDNALLGSRHLLRLEYQDNDDGQRTLYHFSKPFYSLESFLSYGVYVENDLRIEPFFDKGEEFTEFLMDKDIFNSSFGWSSGVVNKHVKRFQFGFSLQEYSFSATADTDLFYGLPEDRKLSYPWFQFNYIEHNFVKIANIEQLHRREDINLGDEITVRLGWTSERLGADRDGPILDISGQRYLLANEDEYLNYSYTGHFFYNRDKEQFENSKLATEIEYNYLQTQQWRFNTSLSVVVSENLYLDQPLNLGGSSGLRGYPQAYTRGKYKALLSIEERYFSDIHLWNLIRVGAAGFVDFGQVFEGENNRLLANVGLGLRLSSSRAELGKVLHIDYAVPIADKEYVDSYQWFITIKSSF